MTHDWLAALEPTLAQVAGILLALGAAAGLLIGFGLLLKPAWATTWLQRGDAFEPSWFWERFFYRHHHAFGALIVLGAIYILVTLPALGGAGRIAETLRLGGAIGIITVETAGALLLVGSLLSLPFGAIIVIRPSLLKGLERRSNRLLIRQPEPRVAAVSHPRLWGLLFVIGAIYTLGGLGLALVPGCL